MLKILSERTLKDSMNVDVLDEETIRMTERLVVIRISTKHINLWMRQLEVRRKEMIELGVDGI